MWNLKVNIWIGRILQDFDSIDIICNLLNKLLQNRVTSLKVLIFALCYGKEMQMYRFVEKIHYLCFLT